MEYRYYIGIDPDTENSGIAVWDKHYQNYILISNMDFWTLINFLSMGYANKTGQLDDWSEINFIVVIDAGWLVKKTNFHHHKGGTRDKVSVNVGRNHQVGILIMEYCMRNGLNYSLHEPSGKMPANTFQKLTGWKESTNQDSRDAAMIVFKR